MNTVDARDQGCPKPIMMTKKIYDELAHGDSMTTLSDSRASAENVSSFIKEAGGTAEIVEDGGIYRIVIVKGDEISTKDIPAVCPVEPSESKGKSINSKQLEVSGTDTSSDSAKWGLLLSSDRFGEANPPLGTILIRAFINTLGEGTKLPEFILFINDAVRLTAGSNSISDKLSELENEGVEILSCGTCLEYLGLINDLKVGQVTNMLRVVERLSGPVRIVRL